ncbi:hypothetical protein CYMTET_10144 [Cymbomonas tetramitiformis]|uniref:Uncharacterized protein n=1 Tax=Cymbomonas tetramitiformis TaxID=36881 RepID=A0AAE0LEG0_9CHLO|nr:hypothetical protein CYMTET_10144 [Cymbomonas tetramitiformis]
MTHLELETVWAFLRELQEKHARLDCDKQAVGAMQSRCTLWSPNTSAPVLTAPGRWAASGASTWKWGILCPTVQVGGPPFQGVPSGGGASTNGVLLRMAGANELGMSRIKDGDRLTLELDDAITRPSKPNTVILPEHTEKEPEPPPEYDPQLDLVQRAVPGFPDFDHMLSRPVPTTEIDRTPDYHPVDSWVEQYPPAPVQAAHDFGKAPPRFHEETTAVIQEGDRLELNVDEAATRRQLRGQPLFEHQLTRPEAEGHAPSITADLYYDGDIGVLKPRAPIAHLDVRTGHAPSNFTGETTTGDLDAGCYEAHQAGQLGQANVPATDFAAGSERAPLYPLLPALEGDNLLLHPHSPAAQAKDEPISKFEEPMGLKEPRWLPATADEGNTLLLRADPAQGVRRQGDPGMGGCDFKSAPGREDLWGTTVGGTGAVCRREPKSGQPHHRNERLVGDGGPVGFAPHVAPLDGTKWQPLLWPESRVQAAPEKENRAGMEAQACLKEHIQPGAHSVQARAGRMMDRLRKKRGVQLVQPTGIAAF